MTKEKIIKFCDVVIEGCFYFLIAAVTFSTSMVEIISSVMIAAFLVKKSIDRDLSFFSLISVRIAACFFVWVLFSCYNSGYAKESARGVFKVAEYLTIFIIAATTLDRPKIERRFFYVLCVSASIICLDGLVQYFSGCDFIRHRSLIHMDYMKRVSSSFVHPNDFGVYLLIVAVVVISSLASAGTRLRERVAVLFLLGLALAGLFFTKSRGAWISFAASFLVFGALKARRVLALFTAILIVVFLFLPYTAQEYVFNAASPQEGSTAWERLMLWRGTINMIKVHPILGFGVNTYSRNFPKYKPPEYPDVRYTHNSYLHMASEVGIVGALLFLVFLVTVFIYSLRGSVAMKKGRKRDLAMGLFAGLVGFAMNSIVDTHLYSVNLAVLFHLLLGFCFALTCHAEEE